MQQRRLRLGDVLDDYCPRERRVTNHAIVAMIDDEIRQTRCTTCDSEHEFKQGKMPTLRRKKDAVSTAYQEVLAAVKGEAPVPATGPVAPAPPLDAAAPVAEGVLVQPSPAPEAPPLEASENHVAAEGAADGGADEGEAARVHRRLIRATLPRLENQPVTRPIPEFTMHQPIGRPAKFRGGMARGMAGRPVPMGRGGGTTNGNTRGPVFGRPAGSRGGGQGGRAAGGRHDQHRQHRGGQPSRPGKKQPK